MLFRKTTHSQKAVHVQIVGYVYPQSGKSCVVLVYSGLWLKLFQVRMRQTSALVVLNSSSLARMVGRCPDQMFSPCQLPNHTPVGRVCDSMLRFLYYSRQVCYIGLCFKLKLLLYIIYVIKPGLQNLLYSTRYCNRIYMYSSCLYCLRSPSRGTTGVCFDRNVGFERTVKLNR